MADNDSRWIRKATELERLFEIGHQQKVYLTHYTLELASVKPLDEEFLREALIHLYRKVPVLRVCLRKRNSELWMREMERCEIDLKIIDEGELKKERDKMTHHTYNSAEGPLWCVRFISLPKEASSSSSSSSFLQQEENFRFYYALIFGTHHSISDGTTNVKVCNLLCTIMNDLIAGRFIDDGQQLGEISDDEEMISLYDQEMLRLKKDPELCEEIKRELEEGAKVKPLIRHICNIPPDVTVMTKNLVVTFDKSVSEKFHKKAKSEGVTLHCAITGLINLALTKLLQESGIIQDEYNIRAGHDINIRRYYAGDPSKAIGLHGPLFAYRTPSLVPKDMLPVFWETVRVFQEKFHLDVARRRVITTSAYRIMTEDTNKNFNEFFVGEPNYYYTISNMGNLTGMLSEGVDSICIRRLIRFSSLRNRASYMCFFVHTFRSQLNFSIAYSTNFLTYEFVHRLKELIEIHMLPVCHM